MEPTVLSLSSLAFNELEAFVELMFLAAYTDGEVAAAERAAFRGQVIKGTHGQLDGELVEQILAHVERALQIPDREVRLASIRDRLGDARKRHAALVHAARVVLADGVLALDEVAFLRRAAVALGEPASVVEAVLREAREVEPPYPNLPVT
jgi:uncharacterized tellurite resistance protein B-like protein